jgi:hypothetical protein
MKKIVIAIAALGLIASSASVAQAAPSTMVMFTAATGAPLPGNTLPSLTAGDVVTLVIAKFPTGKGMYVYQAVQPAAGKRPTQYNKAGALWISTTAGASFKPTDLIKLRDSWQRAIHQANAPLDKKYEDALAAMKTRFTKDGKLQEALAVDNELKMLASRASSPQVTSPAEKVRHKWVMASRSDFESAKKQATTEKKRLPMLKTEEDQKSFMKFFSKASPKGAAWLDASYDEATMKWVWGDGTPITFFNWADKQPVMTKGAGIEFLAADGTWRSSGLGRALETVLDDPK